MLRRREELVFTGYKLDDVCKNHHAVHYHTAAAAYARHPISSSHDFAKSSRTMYYYMICNILDVGGKDD